MKKLIYQLLGIVLAIAMVGCSSDDLSISYGSDAEAYATMHYTIQLPEDISTRAFADGTTATYLTYAVYKKSSTDNKTQNWDDLYLLVKRDNIIQNGQAEITIQLLKNQGYDIIFWADAGPDCPYTLNFDNGEPYMDMDYAAAATEYTAVTIEGNNESRDAFYNRHEISSASLSMDCSVTLYRPLAQLNIGANDLTLDMVKTYTPPKELVFTTSIPDSLPTRMMLSDGSTTNLTIDSVVFTSTGTPTQSDGLYPVSGYEFMQMNYILEGAETDDSDTTDNSFASVKNTINAQMLVNPVTFTISHANLDNPITTDIYNLPLRSNYRTNVYGELLTTPTQYTITLTPAFGGDTNEDTSEDTDDTD